MKYLSLLFFTYLLALPLFAQQNSREGKDLAVFFTEEYKGPWTKLPHISEEVAEIKTILQEKYHFSVEECKNKDKTGIEQKIRELQKRAYETDAQLLLFFSGHGVYYEAQNEGFFIPYNAPTPSEPNSESNYLSYLFLRPLINTIPCNHILVMIDACHGGSFVDEVAFKEEPEWEVDKNAKGEWINAQLKEKTRFFAAAANKKERAPSKSDFASKFIDALKNPQEGIVSIHVLQSHLEKAKPAPYFSGFGYHNGGNFLFMTTESLTPLPPPAPLDTDKDGIPDKYDDCPTEIGVECASGCPDKDGDCITEKFGKDDCPDEKGERAFDGCPDTDKDGVPDYKDKCKNVYAETENGCPPKEPPKEVFPAPTMIYVEGNSSIKSFYIGETEITIGQYLQFCNATNSHYPEWLQAGNKYNIKTGSDSYYKNKGISESTVSLPIVGVNWYDAVAYCDWLKIKTGENYRLPTEAEWEYAAKGGNKSKSYEYAGSNNITKVAWYSENSDSKPHSVKGKNKNELGLYDISGNVWEWCNDWYDNEQKYKVLRGGSWFNYNYLCRVSFRNYVNPTNNNNDYGFRVVR